MSVDLQLRGEVLMISTELTLNNQRVEDSLCRDGADAHAIYAILKSKSRITSPQTRYRLI